MLLHWFRRDLRLRDNPALGSALRESGGQVIPVFVLDDAILSSPRMSPARVRFLFEALHDLDAQLRARGSRLIIRRGDPAAELRALAERCGASGVRFNRDYTPYARRRDEQVSAALRAAGLSVAASHDTTAVPPGALRTANGQPYTVFTPYFRAWRAAIEQEHTPPPESDLPPFASVPEAALSLPLPEPPALPGVELPRGGETAGLDRLRAFLDPANPHGIGSYGAERDVLALPSTSRLSPYIHFGCVAMVTALRGALDVARAWRSEASDPPGRSSQPRHNSPISDRHASAEKWIAELAWREFYVQILFHFPYVLRGAFRPAYDQLAWENDSALFAAWRAGRTGYPIVDAAMRQLEAEAWMHNRARMIAASFLVKDLLIDWRWGERHFLQKLVDADHAANNGGWQWVAGTGTDAQPFFRVFNPVSQGKKFDPQGAYVRRYLPELANVPDEYIHEPWAMPAEVQRRAGIRIGRHYPAPIVDHDVQRARALALYRAVR
jgi:deoxyribodipyrimidine photo-lyase